MMALEELLARKHIEGISVPKVHKHLTNALFNTLTLWVRINDYWKLKAPNKGRLEGHVAYEIDEEGKETKGGTTQEKDEVQGDMEEIEL